MNPFLLAGATCHATWSVYRLLMLIIMLAILYPLHRAHSNLKARIETLAIHHKAPPQSQSH